VQINRFDLICHTWAGRLFRLFVQNVKPNVRWQVRKEANAVLRDAGLTAERARGESISFKLLYSTAHLLSHKPTADWFRLRNVSVEQRLRGGEHEGHWFSSMELPRVQCCCRPASTEANLKLKLKLSCNRPSVGQCVLVSGSNLELMTRFFFSALKLWGS
jgi:hypothetical protein